MDESNSLDVTFNFLKSGKQALPKIPQLNYNIHNTIEKVAHSKGEKVGSESKINKCTRCFVAINYARTSINLSDRNSDRKLSIKCHFCKTLLSESNIDFEPINEPIRLEWASIKESEVLSKKKRKRSDKSAGLILPNAPTKSKLPKNNPKLKSLLDANSSETKKGKLMEFLSKM